ncbi:MAG: fumarylacetoacetate hydrolase family protein [Chloroflexi bacterium]|nr:fumarylacetoacetate hydrolase family protein [Chloroflexota bacterium]MBU1746789.1 fumarylacetoacetate hydrolase family protein [Chloroflexota bacterium]MBU1878662.1 fumarylacetoacetate hydrolase family protein [Chloroflexota bacterium]
MSHTISRGCIIRDRVIRGYTILLILAVICLGACVSPPGVSNTALPEDWPYRWLQGVPCRPPCCHAITPAEAAGVVWGYTCANDVTARDLQKRGGGPWSRGKGYDTFCPLGPWIETDLDPGDLRITTRVAGEIRQDSRTSLMIYNIPTLVSFISYIMTLEPGDVVLTGTPAGVGPVVPDQPVEVEVEGIGVLRNRVAGPQ